MHCRSGRRRGCPHRRLLPDHSVKKFLRRLLDAMAKATTDEERKALYDLIETIRDDQDGKLDDDFFEDLEDKLDDLGL